MHATMLTADVADLPRDLDGTPYRVDDTLGPWKVTPCCGAYATGVEDGVVCRRCYNDVEFLGGGYYDGPAHLDPAESPQPPATLLLNVADMTTRPGHPAASYEYPRNADGDAVRDEAPLPSGTPYVADVRMVDEVVSGTPVITVGVTWAVTGGTLDRPYVGGICVPAAKRTLAERLQRAMRDGAAHGEPEVRRDRDGKTYVHADAKVMGRYLNADLKRLGY